MRNIWIGGLLSGLFIALALVSYLWTPSPPDGVPGDLLTAHPQVRGGVCVCVCVCACV